MHRHVAAEHLDTALVGPCRLIEGPLAAAPHPPPDPAKSARLMAAQRAYLLDTLGDGRPRRGALRRGARRRATEALEAMWERLLA